MFAFEIGDLDLEEDRFLRQLNEAIEELDKFLCHDVSAKDNETTIETNSPH